MKKPKILMYHSIGKAVCGHEAGTELYSVSEEDFHDQIEYIAKVAKVGTVPFWDSLCIITFDDGFLNNYRVAFPVLREFELKAYFFITINRIGGPGYMNWEKIKELHSAGMVIGSHGMTHTILHRVSDEKLDYEIKESKMILEDKLGAEIKYFSIPRGFYNKKVIDKAKEVGYKAVFTSNIKDSDGFKFGRIPVKGDWDSEYFIRVLNNGFSLKDRAKSLIKNSSKKILGIRNYDKLRTRILEK